LTSINLEYKYQKLIEEYKIITEDLNPDIKSLLFFEGHDDELKNKFMELTEEFAEIVEINNDVTKTEETVSATITSIEMGIAPVNKTYTGLGHKRVGTYSQKRDAQNKKAGKKAEKLVCDKLRELYPDGEIRWISGNSEDNSLSLDDTKGYDISYKKNNNEEHWKYLEVKSCSNGKSFIISANEVDVGIENKENYHLALVSGFKIHFVEDFFLDESRLAEFELLRNRSSIRPLEYEVYFNLVNLK
jgi:hypothetical protein